MKRGKWPFCGASRRAGVRAAALVAASLAVASPLAALDRCDRCSPPDVLQFDFDVLVPRPPSGVWNRDTSDFMRIHSVDDVANDELFNANQDCVGFRDGDLVMTGVVRQSNSIAFPPPAGKIDTGDDYLFTGEIAREAEGLFRVSMFLETACSRRRVLSTTGTITVGGVETLTIPKDSEYWQYFTDEYWLKYWNNEVEPPPPIPKEYLGPDWTDSVAALAREAFVPLLPKIREFERRLRQTDRRYALGLELESLRVVPARRHVKPFERVPVEITLTDCDGEPLPGRELLLDPAGDTRFAPSENGRFEEPRVTTDDAGKATATFVVGARRGVAIANVGVLYLLPSGCESGWVGDAVLDVDGAAGLYEVRFDYERRRVASRETTEPLEGGSRTSSYREVIELRMGCTGVWENPEEAQREGYIELSGAPVAGCRPTGEYRGTEMSRDRAHVDSPSGGPGLSASSWTRAGTERRRTFGSPVDPGEEQVDLFFWYKGGSELDSSQFGIQVPFAMKSDVSSEGFELVSSGGIVIRTPFSDEQSDTDRTSFNGAVPDSTYTEERASVVVEGTADSREEELGTTIDRHARVRAVITPVRSLEDAAPARPALDSGKPPR